MSNLMSEQSVDSSSLIVDCQTCQYHKNPHIKCKLEGYSVNEDQHQLPQYRH